MWSSTTSSSTHTPCDPQWIDRGSDTAAVHVPWPANVPPGNLRRGKPVGPSGHGCVPWRLGRQGAVRLWRRGLRCFVPGRCVGMRLSAWTGAAVAGAAETSSAATTPNVVLTYMLVEKSDAQVAYYDPGVGTGGWEYEEDCTLKAKGDQATGHGLQKNVEDAYRYLMACYQPGDRVFLFGFSRGALHRAVCWRGCSTVSRNSRRKRSSSVERRYRLLRTRRRANRR